jgi:hypothetical protein
MTVRLAITGRGLPPQLLLFKRVVSGVAIHIFRVPLCRAEVSVSSFFDVL